MASPARIVKTLPNTLPADFGEWDEKSASAAVAAAASATGPVPGSISISGPTIDTRIATLPASAPAPYPSAAPETEFPHSRPPQHAGKAYVNEKSFLDQLISMNAPTNASVNASGNTPAAATSPADAQHTAPLLKPLSVRSGSQAANSQTASSPRRLSLGPVAMEKSRPAPRSAANAIALEPLRIKAVDIAEPKSSFRLSALAPITQNKKLLVAAAAGAAAVLLLILLLAFALSHTARPVHSGNAATLKPAPIAAATQPDAFKPSPAMPVAGTTAQPASDAAPAADAQAAPAPQIAPQVQAQMMNDQLSAPARISADMKTKAPEDAPPSQALDAADLGGSANPATVLGGQSAPRVQAAPPRSVNVSAGVAVGLLIQKTPPIYPPIAKTARVSGTVVLEAAISKSGAIQNLRVVTGPEMLRQSALEAVRTWRFKPYKLNNEPTEIETTINVVFALNQ
jgi:periplasmic protein TonB